MKFRIVKSINTYIWLYIPLDHRRQGLPKKFTQFLIPVGSP